MPTAGTFIICQRHEKINWGSSWRWKKIFSDFAQFELDNFKYLWYYNIRSAWDSYK